MLEHHPSFAALSGRRALEFQLQSSAWVSKKFLACAVVLGASGIALTGLNAGSATAAPGVRDSSDQAQIVAAVARAAPSVVAIDVNLATSDGDATMPAEQGAGRASGSGFVYSSAGEIVTNAHVVSGPTGTAVRSIVINFANGDRVPAHVTSLDPSVDIALLKVDGYAKLPPPLPLGDARSLKAGQWAIAIGEPLELKQSVTVGVVSAFNRSEAIGDGDGGNARQFSGLLQTSAPINPGNSGGPLIDMSGRVIGINQAVAGGAQGIGFAIPIDTVRTTVAMLQQQPAAGPDVASVGPAAPGEDETNPSGDRAPSEDERADDGQ